MRADGMEEAEAALERIDLMRDRTGAGYAACWRALREARGDVVRAIVLLEDRAPREGWGRTVAEVGGGLLRVAGEVGAVRLAVRRRGRTLAELPAVAGVAAAVLFPRATAVGVLVALATRCSLAVERPPVALPQA